MTYRKLLMIWILSAIQLFSAVFMLAMLKSTGNTPTDDVSLTKLSFLVVFILAEMIEANMVMDESEKIELNRKANEPLTKRDGIRLALGFFGSVIIITFITFIIPTIVRIVGEFSFKIIMITLLVGYLLSRNFAAWKKYQKRKIE